MATLFVWTFETQDGAAVAATQLGDLRRQRLVHLDDAAVVSWAAGEHLPRTRQAFATLPAEEVTTPFWGLLTGLVFLVPMVATVTGVATSDDSGVLVGLGIEADFVASIREVVTDGTSALFVIAARAQVDRVLDEVDLHSSHQLQTPLQVQDDDGLHALLAR